MSVLIKGMDMPKNCGECPMICEDDLCRITKGGRTLAGRPPHCPLISLPPINVHPHDFRIITQTNADRIRSMTDEELADWLIMNGDGSDYQTWLAWLKQEAEDEP